MESLGRIFGDIMEKRVIVGLIALLIGCVIMPIKEMRYVLWGREVAAALVSVKKEYRQEGDLEPWQRVTYEFDDDGRARSESDLVTLNWPVGTLGPGGSVAKGATIAIEYLPGGSSSRLKGNDDKGWFWASGVVAVLSVIVAACWWKFRDAGTYKASQ